MNTMQNNEDFERESAKDSVYLLEQMMQEEKDFWEWYENVHRQPAEIYIINQDKIPIKNESEESDILPF